jgi:hypothetical protein
MNYDRRLDRLASILPEQRERLGDRRKDDELRARVDDLPEDLPNREEILERRRRMARAEYEEAIRILHEEA